MISGDGRLYKDFEAPDVVDDPGYQFRLKQGERAIDRQYGPEGQKGAHGKALVQYGQEMASQEYGAAYGRALTTHQQNYGQAVGRYNRIAGVAGVGQQTSVQLAQLGQQSAQNQAGAIQYGASALGAGEVGYENALLSGEMAAYNAKIARNNQLLTLGLTVAGGRRLCRWWARRCRRGCRPWFAGRRCRSVAGQMGISGRQHVWRRAESVNS